MWGAYILNNLNGHVCSLKRPHNSLGTAPFSISRLPPPPLEWHHISAVQRSLSHKPQIMAFRSSFLYQQPLDSCGLTDVIGDLNKHTGNQETYFLSSSTFSAFTALATSTHLKRRRQKNPNIYARCTSRVQSATDSFSLLLQVQYHFIQT